MHTFEVEVKVLLGKKDPVDRLLVSLRARDPDFSQMGGSSQLNHYFDTHGDVSLLKKNIRPFLSDEQYDGLSQVLSVGKKHSVRTRDADGTVILVVKADKDAASDSMHGNMRYEWEAIIDNRNSKQISNTKNKYSKQFVSDFAIDDLDTLLLSCGFGFLSKWSRERKEYRYKDMTVCIDKNAGYGYLAEFEKVVQGEIQAEEAKRMIKEELSSIGLEELSQDRLGRMFMYYNQHWKDYYRTEKTFEIV